MCVYTYIYIYIYKGPAPKSASKPSASDEEEDDDALLEMSAQRPPDEEALEEAAEEAGVLTMRRKDFSAESERLRATGHASGAGIGGAAASKGRRHAASTRGGGEGRTAHHRRLFLVSPTSEEPWPRPEACMAMTSDTDAFGAAVFDFEETPASSRALEQLREILKVHDPGLVQNFLQKSPFCVDALLVLAEYHRSQSSHEQAFQLIRRATYALECNLAPGFSPFHQTGVGPSAQRPRVSLRLSSSAEWPGWSWLRTMWLLMQGLAGQGMHRTSLEVCKLLLAASLPRDPVRALLWCDWLCLRARQYDTLARVALHLLRQHGLAPRGEAGQTLLRLDLALPNFAFSLPLAGFLKGGSQLVAGELNEVSVSDVAQLVEKGAAEAPCEDGAAPAGAAAHAQLMCAMLLFPLMLRPLLEAAGVALLGPAPAGSPSRETWAALLSQSPFSEAAECRHARHASAHGRIVGAYAKRCGPLWRAQPVQLWLHACAARLVGMHASAVFAADLAAAKLAWSTAVLCPVEALEQDYLDLLPEEGSPENPLPPPFLEKAAQARLYPPRVAAAQGWGQRVFGGGELEPTISLHSPPLMVFFQSLMPWGELDKSGIRVEPFGYSELGGWVVGSARSVAAFSLGALCDVGRLVGSAAEAAREAQCRFGNGGFTKEDSSVY